MFIISTIVNLETKLTAIADAIRSKGETTEELTLDGMVDAINNLQIGSSENNYITIENDTYSVKVIDYDGTILSEERLKTGEVFTLPTPPTNERLTFEEWSSSAPITNNTVTVECNDIMIGATYHTASGATEFDIELSEDNFGLTLSFDSSNIGAPYHVIDTCTSIDWGDGTIDSNLSHTYTDYGTYTIRIYGATVLTKIVTRSGALAKSIKGIYLSDTITEFVNNASTGTRYFVQLGEISLSNSIENIIPYTFQQGLETVVIPNSITKICDDCFASSYSLKNVIIPNTITYIGQSAFTLSIIESIVIPSSVKQIASSAFAYCTSLKSVNICYGIEQILYNAFANCTSLEELIMPDSVTTIVRQLCSYCTSLKKVKLSKNISMIDYGLFIGCSSLKEIEIPDTVTMIGEYAFNNCISLENLYIPDTVTNIGSNAFYNVPCITYDGDATGAPWGALKIEYTAGLFQDDVRVASWNELVNDYGLDIGDYNYLANSPSNITEKSIPSYHIKKVLENFTSANVLKIPSKAKYIGFYGLSGITIDEVVVGKNVEIMPYSFYQCKISTLTIKNELPVIPIGAFNKSYLSNVVLGEGIKYIEKDAFEGCKKNGGSGSILFNLPQSLLLIGEYGFGNIDTSVLIELSDEMISLGAFAFYGTSITSISVPKNITCIPYNAFYNSQLSTITFSSEGKLKVIGKNAFYGTNLTSIEIPYGVKIIEDGAFNICSALMNVIIPNSVTTIGDYAFQLCNSLTDIVIPDTVATIGKNAFYNVPHITYHGTAEGAPWGALSMN